MSTPNTQDFSGYDYDQLTEIAKSQFGFAADEVKILFPTDERLREALVQAQSLRGRKTEADSSTEDGIGWDETSEVSDLPDEAKRLIAESKTSEKERKMVSEAERKGTPLASPSEVEESMSELQKLLRSVDDEDEGLSKKTPGPLPSKASKATPKQRPKGRPKKHST